MRKPLYFLLGAVAAATLPLLLYVANCVWEYIWKGR